MAVRVERLDPSDELERPKDTPPLAHHTISGFCNPWSSFENNSVRPSFKHFLQNQSPWHRPVTSVPVPEDPKDRPVQVVKPDWEAEQSSDGLRATWIGHASWLLEFGDSRSGDGFTVLLDPVFSERTSPVSWFGPKRYTPTPCTIEDLPPVDLVVISHNHYDHCDVATLQQLWRKQYRSRPLHFGVPLKLKTWFLSAVPGVSEEDVTELDWWDGRLMTRGGDTLRFYASPSQHASRRGISDGNKSLWCGWLFTFTSTSGHATARSERPLSCFFAGDTGYRYISPKDVKPLDSPSQFPGREVLDRLPFNPTFEHIGRITGGVDLALLPIGLFNPLYILSNVHASPWDAVDMHQNLKAKTSVAMHYGVIRGGLSGVYEPIDVPRNELEAACGREKVPFAKATVGEAVSGAGEFLWCDVGQTVIVSSRSASTSQVEHA